MTRTDWSFRFLSLTLAGPMIWAVTFSLVYALHGAGCAWGWPEVDVGFLSLHRLAMLAAWGAGLLVGAGLVVALPRRAAFRDWLPRACAWVGLVATFFTLLPIVVTSSC